MTENSVLDAAEVARLACPRCRDGLLFVDKELRCRSVTCGSVFPIVGGVPILIDEATSVFSIRDFTDRRDTYFSARKPLLNRVLRLVPSTGFNLKARENYATFVELLLRDNEKPRVLVLGGGIVGEGAEELLKHDSILVVESDVALSPRVSIVLDGHRIPFRDGAFDGVVAQAVLEHVADPYMVVDEIHRVLRTDGIVYAETPFMQQVHGGRFDFTRFTHLGHRRLFRRFDEYSSGATGGTGMALAWSWKYFLTSLTDNQLVRRFFSVFSAFTSFFLKYIDVVFIDNAGSMDGASGFFFIGRKSNLVLSDKDLIRQYRGALY